MGLFFVFCGLLILLSLWTFDIKDPTLNQSVSGTVAIRNSAGMFGAYLSGFLTDIFGFASYLWGVFFVAVGAGLVSSWFVIPWYRWIGYVLLSACLITAAESWGMGIKGVRGGGMIGAWLYAHGHTLFSPIGSALVWVFALLAAMELSFKISWLALTAKGASETAKQIKKLPKPVIPKMSMPKLSLPAGKKKDGFQGKATDKDRKALTLDIMVDDPASPPAKAAKTPERGSKHETRPEAKDADKKDSNTKPDAKHDIKPDSKKDEKTGLLGRLFDRGDKHDASEDAHKLPLPSFELLTSLPLPKPGESTGPDMAVLETKGKALVECLQSFGVQATLANIRPGPVVTMFELRPAPGIKASRFVAFSQDIAMALKAVAVRVQAPIPGTDTVGVEVPNEKRLKISFREIVQNETFRDSPSLLTVALGKDTGGRAVAADLARMPHLLVAGATGAGKSVCLNSIILSLLYKARPDEVQMMMIDPKQVEMSAYADLPHLVHPVVTDMELAKNALLWAIEEMDRRYKLLKLMGVPNITRYNEKLGELPDPRPEGLEDLEAMPFLVIIVDELADLMMLKGKDVEMSIVRLAQLARAAGIHLILATQRPSVDVVTGILKNNLPCRIAFRVTSHHDSRTILDSNGAESLLGDGDMLFKPSGNPIRRLHGAFVSDAEVTKVVNHWKSLRQPDYKIDFSDIQTDETLKRPQRGEGMPDKDDVGDDPIYAEAVQFVRELDEISISALQRRFRIGFNRSARYIEQMEKDGLLAAGESGGKGRKVLK